MIAYVCRGRDVHPAQRAAASAVESASAAGLESTKKRREKGDPFALILPGCPEPMGATYEADTVRCQLRVS